MSEVIDRGEQEHPELSVGAGSGDVRSVGNTPRASALSLSAARGRGAAHDDRSRPPTGERPSQRAHSQRIGSNSQTFRSQSLEGIREESQQSSGSSAPNQL